MITPCKSQSCLVLPMCRNKNLYIRISECPSLRDYFIMRVIKRTETGQITIPNYIIVDDNIYEVTVYPDMNGKYNEPRQIIGLTNSDRQHRNHVGLESVSAYKEIKSSYPAVKILLEETQ
jgi:hypothetical protein